MAMILLLLLDFCKLSHQQTITPTGKAFPSAVSYASHIAPSFLAPHSRTRNINRAISGIHTFTGIASRSVFDPVGCSGNLGLVAVSKPSINVLGNPSGHNCSLRIKPTHAVARRTSILASHLPNSSPTNRKKITSPSTKLHNMSSSEVPSPGRILESPSAERNKGPIWDSVLSPVVLPPLIQNAKETNANKIKVLELAAGCGVHTVHFTSSFLSLQKESDGVDIEWHPSDPDLDARASIDARVAQSGLSNHIVPANGWVLGVEGGTACNEGKRGDMRVCRDLGADAGNGSGLDSDPNDFQQFFDLALCVNMIHIAPWGATLGLMECAGKVLRKGGILVCYGPYKVGGTAVESNLRFDEALRSKNPQWGVRNLEDVVQAAEKEGLGFVQSVEMPANNLSVLFRKN